MYPSIGMAFSMAFITSLAAIVTAHVTFDVGKAGGIKKGMKLRAYREGPPIQHPVTGQTLPGVKEWLAEAEVTYADETTSEAKVIQWLTKPINPLHHQRQLAPGGEGVARRERAGKDADSTGILIYI